MLAGRTITEIKAVSDYFNFQLVYWHLNVSKLSVFEVLFINFVNIA